MPAERAAAEALLGRPIDRIVGLASGGNNRLYRVTAGEMDFAMKHYEADDPSGRQRFAREIAAVRFLSTTALADRIPDLIAADEAGCVALFDWVEGARPLDRRQDEIQQVVDFVRELVEAGDRPGASDLGPAAAACFSGADLVEQIGWRRGRLDGIDDAPELARHLARFDALWSELRPEIERDLKDDIVLQALRVLSPSDFGFHNMLRRPDDRLIFLDFEYFGWDDPVKLTADMLWHPGMVLSPDEADALKTGLTGLFGGRDAGFSRRLAVALPAYGLCWCLILLNEFLPARWARRRLAQDFDPAQWATAKQNQLVKADQLIARVEARRAETIP